MKLAKIIFLLIIFSSFVPVEKKQKPTVYMIGDSTVKNGQGDGAGGLWGWGDFIGQFLDTSQVFVENHALGGTSSRTFQTFGLWTPVLEKLKPGDYVLMQFGHNDAGNLNDNHRARGTIKGVGDESEEIDNILTKKHEIVHTYGWYMKKYIAETKAKGAEAIVLSQPPRNIWLNGKVERVTENYGKWSKYAAEEENGIYIDLNEVIAAKYEKIGSTKVNLFFPKDHTHTNIEGAQLNALTVAETIQNCKESKLRDYIILPKKQK